MSKILGIDLGTTNSAIAVVQNGVPQLLDHAGQTLLPSVVGYTEQGRWLVGTPARNQFGIAPENTIRSVKRKMGSNELIHIGNETLSPSEISAFILRELKRIAELSLGEEATDVVITVPAYFSDAQRQATQDAGRIAGFNVRRIINEPTAAALAYGLNLLEDQIVLVYDLGGGTFDVSVVELMGGVVEVLASHGDTQLGGDDFDLLLADLLAQRFEEAHAIDVRDDVRAWARLLDAAEQAKIKLSSQTYVTVKEEYLITQNGVPYHLETEINRREFQEITDDLLQKTLESVNRVLSDADVGRDEIDHVLLVGGSTRMPAVRTLITDELEMQPHDTINPDEAVALGAATQAAIIAGEPIDAILVDVTPFSLGIAVVAELFGRELDDRFKVLIPRNTAIPVSREELFYAVHSEQTEIRIEVYQGEEPIASANTPLGDFLIGGLQPASVTGDLPEITVRFDFDVNGMLTVTALDRIAGNAADMTIDAPVAQLDDRSLLDAQARVAEMGDVEDESIAFSAEMTSLINRAHAFIGSETLEADELNTLTTILQEIDAAQATGNTEQLDELQERLLDVLFDLDMEA